MGVTITTPSAPKELLEAQQQKDVAIQKAQEVTELELQVDEFVLLTKELEDQKPKLKRVEELRKSLQSVADENDSGGNPVALTGTVGAVVFSAKSSNRTIKDMNGLIGALKAKIGYEALVQLLNLTLGNVDKYLSAEESAPYIGTKPGSRSVEAVLDKEEAAKKGLL